MPDSKKYDLIVVGSGLGGLMCAYIFAKEGKSVCVLEKNNQVGGNLQTFSRDKCIFDTGIHYVGGLQEGQPLYNFFQYFGLMDVLKIKRLDEDGFEQMIFKDISKTFHYGMGYENFIRVLCQDFPEEEKAIRKFVQDMQDICEKFPMYSGKEGEENFAEILEILSINLVEYLDQLTENKVLKNVLAATNLLYAGKADKTPLYVHALVINSYIESAYRMINGGSQIGNYLAKEIRKMGGKIIKHAEVVHFEGEKLIEFVQTKNGIKYYADLFIANIHPDILMDMVPSSQIRPAYRNRLKNIENTTSTFIVNLILKKNVVKYRNFNIYYYDSIDVWEPIHSNKANWPDAIACYFPAQANGSEYVDSLTLMAYMDMEPVKKWENTFNTVAEKKYRGEDYEHFKNEEAQKLIHKAFEVLPELEGAIEKVYISTPLTYRDYIYSKNGSLYGFLKNSKEPLNSFLSPKTRIPNLLLTGQNLHLHGVYGVTVTAFKTCAEVFGNAYLVEKIRKSNTLISLSNENREN